MTAFTVVSHGAVEDRYGQDTIIEASRLLKAELPDLRVVLLGRGKQAVAIQAQIESFGLGDVVRFEGWVTEQRGDPRALARAIKRLHDDPSRREELARNGRIAQETHGWAVQRRAYLRGIRRAAVVVRLRVLRENMVVGRVVAPDGGTGCRW